jgi:hypothetical protein
MQPRKSKKKSKQQPDLSPSNILTLSLFPPEQQVRELAADTYYDVNFLRLPFAFLDKAKKGSNLEIDIPLVTNYGKGRWKVSPNVSLGAAGPFEDAVFMAISKLISDMKKPISNPISIGSLTRLCKIMDVSKSMIPQIKESLRRLASLLCTSEFAYFNKDVGRFLAGLEGVFHIFDKVIFVSEDTGDGTTAQSNLIWLNDTIVRNINGGYVCPLDSDLYFSLKKPTAKALLKMFMEIFYATGNQPYIMPRYSTICRRWSLAEQSWKSLAEQHLGPALKELQQQNFISQYSFDKIPGIDNDWHIKVWKGKVWLNYYATIADRSTNKYLASQQPLIERSESLSAADRIDVDEVTKALVTLSMDKKTASYLVRKFGAEKVRDCITKFRIKSKADSLGPGYLKNMIVKADHEDIKAFVDRYDQVTKKKEVKDDKTKKLSDAKEIYYEQKERAVQIALAEMAEEERMQYDHEATQMTRMVGIEIVDKANLFKNLVHVVAESIKFPTFKEWTQSHYKPN